MSKGLRGTLEVRPFPTVMDIIFCDLCNESVPEVDLEKGNAIRRGERVICSSCEAAMSPEHPEDQPTPADSKAEPAQEGGAKVPTLAAAAEAPGQKKSADDTTIVETGLPVVPRAPVAHAPSSAGAAVGVALASVALLLAVGATAFLFDQIESRHGEALRIADRARTDAQDLAHTMEVRLSGDLRDATTDLADSRAEIRELRTRLDELGNHHRDTLDTFREDLVRLEERTGELDSVIAAVDRHEVELSKVADTAAGLHAEVLRVGDRLNSVEQTGDRLLTEASVQEEEERPEWLPLVDDLASQNSGTRWQAVQSLGATRDPEVAEYLTPMLKDPDIFVRMATARILGDLGAVIGIPPLIDALEDPEASVREAAVVSLRSISGRDFRFDPGAREAERAKRVKAWRDWWKKASEELLGTGNA